MACWFDVNIPTGARWDEELRDRVDQAAALVVVMSPTGEASPWIRLEVGRALNRGVPVHPLLLDGRRFDWLAHLQYEAVQPGQVLPSNELVERLRAAVTAPARQHQPSDGTRLFPERRFPLRNPHFVGRDELLLQMETGLYWGRTSAPRRGPATLAVQALHGTGGVGKTQLAAEYVYRRAAEYDLIVWVDAEQTALIPTQLADLATLLDVPARDEVNATARAVVTALGKTGLRWLVVFDNAEQAADLTEWLPRAGSGHVIVTSRQTGWSHLGATVDVDVLAPEAATQLLCDRVSGVDESTARSIVDLLGYLPLAVEQAAGYLESTGMAAGDYLRLLTTRGEALLAEGHVPGYEHTLATVWDLSQASLHTASPAGAQLLRLCAFLGPEPIPLALFTNHPDLLREPLRDIAADELSFNNAVGALLARSLARRSPDGQALTVHRLLATAVRRPLSEADRAHAGSTARHLLHQYLPSQIQYAPHNWPTWRAMLPHVLAATRNPTTQPEDRRRTADLLNTAATYLATIGRRADAVARAQEAVTLYRELAAHNGGAHLPALATSTNNYANHLAQAGWRDQALTVAEEALNLYRQLAARNRDAYLPDLAMAVNNYANHLAQAGRHADALTAAKEAVTLRRELAALDRDAYLPNLAASLTGYAGRLAETGRRAEALAVSEEAVTLRRELVAVNRDAYLPDLARSLGMFALVRLVLGVERQRAADAAQESVLLLTELETARPGAFAQGLEDAKRLLHLLHGRRRIALRLRAQIQSFLDRARS